MAQIGWGTNANTKPRMAPDRSPINCLQSLTIPEPPMKTDSRAVKLSIWTALIAFGFSIAEQTVAQSPPNSHGLFTVDGKMPVGVDYYPEHWPEERWETDLQLMKEAGFNIVRVGEFSWVLFEPEEGKYEFDWLDRWLKLADKYGIKVILGTPTGNHAGLDGPQVSRSPGDEVHRPTDRVGWPAEQLFLRQRLSPALGSHRAPACPALCRAPVDCRLANRQRIRQCRLPLRKVPSQFPALA